MLMQLQEAKQALDLMGRWEMIDVCDALELLSPLFESEEVVLFYDKSGVFTAFFIIV